MRHPPSLDPCFELGKTPQKKTFKREEMEKTSGGATEERSVSQDGQMSHAQTTNNNDYRKIN